MVNGVSRVHKLDKYNRQLYVVANRPLNTTLLYSNSHEMYNENINLGSRKPITEETFPRPSNDENDAF